MSDFFGFFAILFQILAGFTVFYGWVILVIYAITNDRWASVYKYIAYVAIGALGYCLTPTHPTLGCILFYNAIIFFGAQAAFDLYCLDVVKKHLVKKGKTR